ncbi:Lrp/AsnC family transcriptional regulator [Spongiivirga citrea]|uniref:AsnC family transcriptional regulator n=1 Tax=Spongiivirga citrea TaxID=1481457 RepID=A0A6M0CJF6_9FLAO|nr:Lrp/AsnC family transcriptional regulator [Spongiivirga citrea]NER17732.1 AsnC family transcriptional regulator [Spongiivirga citrea]
MEIDSLNWQILQCLHENARQSNAQIGRVVGLSSPAVAERIKKMQDEGIIKGFTANIDHNKTAHQLKAVITLKAFMGRLKPFLAKVVEFKEVLNCYRITGNENIVMEVVLRDQFHLEELIDKLITYGETKTHIVLSHVVDNRLIEKN